MQIELYIDGEKKIFTTPYVPMLAKRKYLELQAKIEQREHTPSAQELIEENDEMFSILSDIVFGGQFTLEDLYKGADEDYVFNKLAEAIYGIKHGDKKKKEDEEGNEQKGE